MKPNSRSGENGLSWFVVGGKRLEARWLPARVASTANRHTIVMLHEGLGSVSHWRDFPDRLAAATGCAIFVYSRYGHGRSSPLEEPREVSYMHHEGEVVLPALLAQAGIERPVLFGQSDGASIALLYAARYPSSPAGLILEAPHVFVEDITVESIARAKTAYQFSGLPQKLARHHQDAGRTFWGWNNIWLDPRFRAWNIDPCLASIRCPVLLIQGEDDEYGTARQVRAIQAKIPEAVVAMLAPCGHAPHRDQPELVLERVSAFLESTE